MRLVDVMLLRKAEQTNQETAIWGGEEQIQPGRSRVAGGGYNPPVVPMLRAATIPDFKDKMTFLLLTARFEWNPWHKDIHTRPGLRREKRRPDIVGTCDRFQLRIFLFWFKFLQWVCHRKWFRNRPLSLLVDMLPDRHRQRSSAQRWPPCRYHRESRALRRRQPCRLPSILH